MGVVVAITRGVLRRYAHRVENVPDGYVSQVNGHFGSQGTKARKHVDLLLSRCGGKNLRAQFGDSKNWEPEDAARMDVVNVKFRNFQVENVLRILLGSPGVHRHHMPGNRFVFVGGHLAENIFQKFANRPARRRNRNHPRLGWIVSIRELYAEDHEVASHGHGPGLEGLGEDDFLSSHHHQPVDPFGQKAVFIGGCGLRHPHGSGEDKGNRG